MSTIINKPTFKFDKNANVVKSIMFCKEFATNNNCTVLMQLKEHTKPITSETDVTELSQTFFNKEFNKYHWSNQFNN